MKRITALTILKGKEYPSKKIGVFIDPENNNEDFYVNTRLHLNTVKEKYPQGRTILEFDNKRQIFVFNKNLDLDQYLCGHRFDIILWDGNEKEAQLPSFKENILPYLCFTFEPTLIEAISKQIGELPEQWEAFKPKIYFTDYNDI